MHLTLLFYGMEVGEFRQDITILVELLSLVLVLETNWERASPVAKLQTPLKVEQEESGSKKHGLPAEIACRDVLTGVLLGKMSKYSEETPG